MNNRRPFIKVYISLFHKQELSETAKRARISLSKIGQRLLTGAKLTSPTIPSGQRHCKGQRRLCKADLERLGNLLDRT